jgi:hypothetical protein
MKVLKPNIIYTKCIFQLNLPLPDDFVYILNKVNNDNHPCLMASFIKYIFPYFSPSLLAIFGLHDMDFALLLPCAATSFFPS